MANEVVLQHVDDSGYFKAMLLMLIASKEQAMTDQSRHVCIQPRAFGLLHACAVVGAFSNNM